MLSATPFVRQGKVCALAVNGTRRLPSMLEVPTLVESGIAFESVGWYGMFGPARLPADIVACVHASLASALRDPTVIERIEASGAIVANPPPSPAAWSAQVRRDIENWEKAARAAKVEKE